jgi:serine/threonine protein kinase
METGSFASCSQRSAAQDNPRVVAALESYLEALRNGRGWSREEFLAKHFEISEVLDQCLSGLEFIQAAAAQLEQSQLSSATDPADAIPPSARLGDYRILHEIGRGGMGVVYEAEQISLGRRVALKVLPFAAAIDPRHRQRFQIEAQAAAQLHHPHIVPIFNVGCDHGIHYYAMQFVEGRSLAAVLHELRHGADSPDGAEAPQRPPVNLQSTEQAPSSATKVVDPAPVRLATPPDFSTTDHVQLPLSISETVATSGAGNHSGNLSLPPTAVGPVHQDRAFCQNIARLGIEAAEALEHAHSLGILHRDIKPANLLIDPHGALWITDFGLAQFPSDLSLTHTGDVVGTLRYMSPEQALARRGVVDQRTDIYSLGVTLYELLTLQPAMNGSDHQELLRQIALEEPIRPRKLNPAVPRDLETIVLKAMAKDPSTRYATAQELAADLGRFMTDQPIRARRPGVLERTLRWARRRKELVATAAAILFLALTIGTAAIWSQVRKTEEQARKTEEQARKTATEARNAEEQARKAEDSLHRHQAFVVASYPLLDRAGMDAIGTAMRVLMNSKSNTPQEVEASQTAQQAVRIFQEAIELPPTDLASRAVIARAYSRLGTIHWQLSMAGQHWNDPNPELLAEALTYHRKAVALFEKLLVESKNEPKIRRWMAGALGFGAMGCCELTSQHPEEAESLYRRSIQIRRELLLGIGAPADLPAPTDTAGELQDMSFLVNTVSVVRQILGQKGRAAEAADMRRQLEDDVSAIAKRFAAPEYQPWRRSCAMQIMQGQSADDENSRRSAFQNGQLALILDPENAYVLNDLAWRLTSVPTDPWFNPTRGLALARKAVQLQPEAWLYLNTLGVAAFRNGEWETATKVLQQSIAFTGGEAHDFFFLAMSHWHQGRKKEARELYEQAVAWTDKNKPDDSELRRFQKEAAALIGQSCPQPKSGLRRQANSSTGGRETAPANGT